MLTCAAHEAACITRILLAARERLIRSFFRCVVSLRFTSEWPPDVTAWPWHGIKRISQLLACAQTEIMRCSKNTVGDYPNRDSVPS